MHIITPYNPYASKNSKTWQEEAWEQQQIAEIEAKRSMEAENKALPIQPPKPSAPTAK
jgi:hypothetical protein